MNILHHKSYHVYNKKNIEKVKNDEEKEREKERVVQERKQLAESEFRLTLLRKKANERLPTTSNSEEKVQHVNLFQDLVEKNTNEEHEAEVKEKKDKLNKQITMYLDNREEEVPWYSQQHQDKYLDKYKFKPKKSDDHKKKRKRPIELQQDPLQFIESHLKKREKKHRKHSSKETTKKPSSSLLSIEELRAKRLERERNEKQRVKELYLGPIIDEPKNQINERHLAYNSQFNRKETLQAKSYRKK